MFNLATNLQSLKIFFLSHMLSKSNLPQLIRKLITRRSCFPNFKLCTRISKKLCYKIRKGFTKVESSTWQQTFGHIKYCSYHIHYPNLTCLSSLKSYLQGISTYQIPSFTPKLVKSCVTKPKRSCEISLRFQALKTIPTRFHSLKSTTIIQFIFLFPPSTKTNRFSPPKESYMNKFPQDSNRKLHFF